MTAEQQAPTPGPLGPLARYERSVIDRIQEFDEPGQEWRVSGYIIVQLAGATLAALFLHAVINVSAMYGSNYPASGYSDLAAFWMELVLTMGLVSVILGTASGAQNVGIIGAFGVGAYIPLAGWRGSPIPGASS